MAGVMSPSQPRSLSWKLPDPAPTRSAKATFFTKSASPTASTASTSPVYKKKEAAEYSGVAGLSKLSNWTEASSSKMSRGQIDWENGDYFMAATMKQLRELDSEAIDAVRVIKSYIGPPPSPASEEEVLTLDELRLSFSDVASDEEEDAVDSDVEIGTSTVNSNAEPVGSLPVDDTNYQASPVMTEVSDSEDDVAIEPTFEANDQASVSSSEVYNNEEDVAIEPIFEANDQASVSSSEVHNNEEDVDIEPILETNDQISISSSEVHNNEEDETTTAQTYYQTHPALTNTSDSESIIPFPDYIDEDIPTEYSDSDYDYYVYYGYEEDEEGLYAKYRAHSVEEEEETAFDVTEPEMNEFRLNPNRADIDMTPEEITDLEDFEPINIYDPEAKRIHAQKVALELARFKGTRNYGFQVVGTNLPGTYYTFENMSDYYGMPLIEFPESIGRLQIDEEVAEYISGKKSIDNLQNFLPKTQPVAMALVLYLTSKGMQPKDITEIIVTLEPRFINERNSRFYNGFHIPEHWEIHNDIVEKILVYTTASEDLWEVVRGFRDKEVTHEMLRSWFLEHEKKSAKFVRSVLENYIGLRIPKPQPKPEPAVMSAADRYRKMLLRMKA